MPIFVRRILQAEPVRAMSGFDVNHLSAKVGKVFADARPGGVTTKFDDLDLFERILHQKSWISSLNFQLGTIS